LSFYLGYVLAPAAVLFAIPCLLPWRWLCGYALVAAAGLGFLWHDHLAYRGAGNGLAEAMAGAVLFFMTAGAIGGVLARLVMLGLRAWGVRWRFAWLPAPIMLALLVAWPWMAQRYHEFRWRPPSAACLSASYRVEIAGATLRLPLAPIFTVFGDRDRKEVYNFSLPMKARDFCDLTGTGRDTAPMRLLMIDFQRNLPRDGDRWPPQLCDAMRERAWLARLCAAPVDVNAEHLPLEITIEAARDARSSLGALYRRASVTSAPTEEPIKDGTAWRLRAAGGAPVAVICHDYAYNLASCQAVFEPRPGLAALFQFSSAHDKVATKTLVVQARVADIVTDLLRE
jgi:hypothetical protein